MASETIEVDPTELNAYARARHEPSPEAVANLSKSEALYWVLDYLGHDTPDGHPDDHNGNVTRQDIKNIANSIARFATGASGVEGVGEATFESLEALFEPPEDEDGDEDEDEDEEGED